MSYSRDGFGLLWCDFRHGPDTEKIWHLYVTFTKDDCDMSVTLDWNYPPDYFDITQTEYQIAIFYVHDGNHHIDMTQQSQYSYIHRMGQEDHFEIRFYQNTAPATPNQPSGPTAKKVGESAAYYAQATDPEGNTVQYRFNWGDGQTSTWTNTVPSGQQASKTHAWQSPGTYNVKAQAKDQYGLESGWSQSLPVTISEQGGGNHPPETPEITEAPTTMIYGETYEFTAVTTDPNDDQIVYHFIWDTGDGDVDIFSELMDSGIPCTVEQSFESNGATRRMACEVRAIDTDDLSSQWSETHWVTVSDPPEEVFITGETSGNTGETYLYQIRGYDPNYNDLVDFSIDWGDGKTDFISDISIMQAVNVSHTWEDNGDYVISVTIYDFNGIEGPTETLPVTMPTSIPIHSLFLRFLENHPYLFPVLRHLLGY